MTRRFVRFERLIHHSNELTTTPNYYLGESASGIALAGCTCGAVLIADAFDPAWQHDLPALLLHFLSLVEVEITVEPVPTCVALILSVAELAEALEPSE